jgi:hypothetical protein
MSATKNLLMQKEIDDLKRCDDAHIKTPFGHFVKKEEFVKTPFGVVKKMIIQETPEEVEYRKMRMNDD